MTKDSQTTSGERIATVYHTLFEAPVHFEQHRLSDGLSLEVVSCGEGTPVLLLPPFNLLNTVWAMLVNAFCKQYRFIMPHYPSVGQSSPVQTLTRPLALCFLELKMQLGISEPWHIIGWSMGGRLAQSMAVAEQSAIRTLIFVNTLMVERREAPPMRKSVSVKTIYQDTFDDFSRNAPLTPDFFSAYADNLLSVLSAQMQREAVSLYFSRSWPDTIPKDTRDVRIERPTLIIAGGKDALTSPSRFDWSKLLMSEHDDVLLPDAGHYIPLFNHALFNQHVAAFWDRVES